MTHAAEENALPGFVSAQLHMPLAKVGEGTYRKFGFTVYHVTLWAPGGVWDAAKPYALKLHYARSVSRDTMADIVVDDIRDQQVADEETFVRWEKTIRDALPAVEDGDTMIGVAVPGKGSHLFFNEKEIAHIRDENLSRAFFNIWLGEHADEELRGKLLNRGPSAVE